METTQTVCVSKCEECCSLMLSFEVICDLFAVRVNPDFLIMFDGFDEDFSVNGMKTVT